MRPASTTRPGPNRTVWAIIVGLAVVVILCGVVTRAVGLPRLCGSVVFLMGLVFLVLANDKRWPALLLLIGALLFFAENLLALLGGG